MSYPISRRLVCWPPRVLLRGLAVGFYRLLPGWSLDDRCEEQGRGVDGTTSRLVALVANSSQRMRSPVQVRSMLNEVKIYDFGGLAIACTLSNSLCYARSLVYECKSKGPPPLPPRLRHSETLGMLEPIPSCFRRTKTDLQRPLRRSSSETIRNPLGAMLQQERLTQAAARQNHWLATDSYSERWS